jgi:hypothetical protein
VAKRWVLAYIRGTPLWGGVTGASRMNRYNLLFATIAASFIAGCVSTPIANPAAESQDEKGRVTGSRLPPRDAVKLIDNKQGNGEMTQRGNGTVTPTKGEAM